MTAKDIDLDNFSEATVVVVIVVVPCTKLSCVRVLLAETFLTDVGPV